MNSTIEITVNGFEETVPEHATIAQLILLFKEEDKDLLVEHNGRFIHPRRYGEVVLSRGDRIEFINPNFGG